MLSENGGSSPGRDFQTRDVEATNFADASALVNRREKNKVLTSDNTSRVNR